MQNIRKGGFLIFLGRHSLMAGLRIWFQFFGSITPLFWVKVSLFHLHHFSFFSFTSFINGVTRDHQGSPRELPLGSLVLKLTLFGTILVVLIYLMVLDLFLYFRALCTPQRPCQRQQQHKQRTSEFCNNWNKKVTECVFFFPRKRL